MCDDPITIGDEDDEEEGKPSLRRCACVCLYKLNENKPLTNTGRNSSGKDFRRMRSGLCRDLGCCIVMWQVILDDGSSVRTRDAGGGPKI